MKLRRIQLKKNKNSQMNKSLHQMVNMKMINRKTTNKKNHLIQKNAIKVINNLSHKIKKFIMLHLSKNQKYVKVQNRLTS
ncbi:hypothetical protein [Staphylococcus pettenkoferi]|uniref:hypothetical protein n=1 Tax=Staphylococcus pettenkoferi TaxID=170573 RepID=UPI0009DB031D